MKKYLVLAFSITLFSCSKGDDSTPSPSANDIAYFRASLNGKAVDFTQSNYLNPVYSQNFTFSGCFLNGQDCVIDYGAFLMPYSTMAFVPSIGLSFDNLYNQSSQANESTTFYSLFTIIPTNFITSSQETNDFKGVDVQYGTIDNKTYSSLGGNQTGSSLTIISSTKGIENGGTLKIQTIIGTVNCKLYNDDNPLDIIRLTNGQFKLIFREKSTD